MTYYAQVATDDDDPPFRVWSCLSDALHRVDAYPLAGDRVRACRYVKGRGFVWVKESIRVSVR